jgi:hypothetical protein
MVTKVKIKSTVLRITGVEFQTDKGTKIQLIGQNQNGVWQKYKLTPDQRVVGCHGYLSGNESLVGLGFIIWSSQT